MTDAQVRHKRLFYDSVFLIGGICCRANFTEVGVDNLFETHGAESGWVTDLPFPDIRASKVMIRVHNRMQGIAKYHPALALTVARDVLESLAGNGSIVSYQDRRYAANLVTKIEAYAGLQSSSPKASPTYVFDQRVIDAAQSRYYSGLYVDAVHRAFEALIEAVQAKAKRPDLEGRDLMFQVFSEKKPILKVSDKPAIQEGFMFLFSGAIGAIRNPHAHSSANSMPGIEAYEMLVVCSYLFRILDQAVKVEPEHTTGSN